MQWFESEAEADAELSTLAELHDKMTEFSGGSDVHTPEWLKQKLHEYYKDLILYSLQRLKVVIISYALEMW